MISLLEILKESKAPEIPEWEDKVLPQIKNIYKIIEKTEIREKVIKNYRGNVMSHKSLPDYETFNFIPKLKFRDLNGDDVETTIGFYFDAISSVGAFWNYENKAIVINIANVYDKEGFIRIVSHELVHAIDPKFKKGVSSRLYLKSQKNNILNYLIYIGIPKEEVIKAYKSHTYDVAQVLWDLVWEYKKTDKNLKRYYDTLGQLLIQTYSKSENIVNNKNNRDEYYNYFHEFDAYSRNIIDILNRTKNAKNKYDETIVDPDFFKEKIKALMSAIPKATKPDDILSNKDIAQVKWFFIDPRQWNQPNIRSMVLHRFLLYFNILKAWSSNLERWKKWNKRISKLYT